MTQCVGSGSARWWAAVWLVLAAGCARGGGPARGGMAVPVVAVPAAVQSIKEQLALVGTLAANEAVDIKSELDGMVDEVAFTEGQSVVAGHVLLRINPRKLAAAVAEAQAHAQLADATLARHAALVASGAVAQQALDQARTDAAVQHASLDYLQAQLEEATVTAPFAGVIGARLVSPGQFVAKGQLLTSLVDTDPMKAEFHVPERFLGQLQTGQRVAVTVAAYPDDAFDGTVYFVAPDVDAGTRTVLVKAELSNPDHRLRHGMFADIGLIIRAQEQAVVIPDTALLYQGDRTFVYVIDDTQHARQRPVTVGVRLADAVEIVDGVQADESVITEGHQKVFPDAPVAPHPPEAMADAPGPA